MTTAAEHLAGFGITMDQAHAFIVANISDPGYIYEICQLAGLTNAMVGEIAGWPGAPVPEVFVEAFFAAYVPARTVVSVSSDSVLEGGSLLFNVDLSGHTAVQTEYSFGFTLDGVGLADLSGFSLTNGVTFNGVAFVVPAGVSGFTLSLGTADDLLIEDEESITIMVGGVSGTGSIADNDFANSDPVVQTVTNAHADEGGNVVHTVTLSAATTASTNFAFFLGHSTSSAGDVGTVTASNGVVIAGNQVTVPSGVTSFTVTIPTVNDTSDESDETFTLSVGGVSGTGTIFDNDVTPSVSVQSVSSAQVDEGGNLVHTVTLSGTTTSASPLSISVGGTASFESDWIGVQLTNGVTFEGSNLLVPVGVSSFNLTVLTVNDTADEPDETVILNVGGVSGTGTILDNDVPPSTGDGAIFDDAYLELTSLLHLNTNSGVLSNASLRAAVVTSTGDLPHYLELFDPSGIDGAEDGTWTTTELGFSHLGNLPATVETLESIFYGTYIHLFKSIDTGEALQLSTFATANQAGLESGDHATIELYVDLILDVAADLAPFPFPDVVISSILVPVVAEMVNLVATGGAPDIFDSLPF
ncbi:MAG TPA: hypothetical protein VK996_13060 [Ramlibacter sp.]|nr:hypothetical protein [Ramlibacter sp.]